MKALQRRPGWVRRHPLFAAALVALILGLTLVGARLATTTPTADAVRYRTMTTSLLETGGFHEESVERSWPQPGEVEAGHTHYFSPLWPLFMVPFYAALGPSGFAVAYLAATALALAVVLVTTRHLWGDAAALAAVAGAGVSLWPTAVQRGPEPLALAFFVAMIYGVLRSIRPHQQRWILLAGAAAGLAYLTRSSVGALFLLGGAAGLAWRIRFHQRRAINRHYAAAILLFALAWGAWAARNVTLFWDGTLAGLPHALASDAVFNQKLRRALEEPLTLAWLVPAKLLWGLVLLAPFLALRGRALRAQLRELDREETSGLLLTWIVPWVLGALVAAVFTIADTAPGSPLLNLDNLRYFLFAVPGLLWGSWHASLLPWRVSTRHDAYVKSTNIL
jgi:4-amino-4-deoxy-L-arabinose transferase-like glycosyltransferase